MKEPSRKPFVDRWRLTVPILLALGLFASMIFLIAFADSPGWLFLVPFLFLSLLAVSIWIVISLLRRL